MAQLVNAKLATRVQVARVFGLHVNTVSRIVLQVAAEGVTASMRHKRGPHGPHKVTPAVVAELRRAVTAGLSTRAAQRQLEHGLKIRLSQRQVHRVMHRLRQQLAEQPGLELLPLATDGGERSAALAAAPSKSGRSSSRPSRTRKRNPRRSPLL